MKYFHVNHISQYSPQKNLEVGDVIELSSKEFNPYYKSILNRQKHIKVGGKEIPLLKFFDGVQRGQYKEHPEISDPKTIAKFAHSLLDDFIQFHRETHFENIRSAEFPHLPSRLNCIWLASSYEEAVSWSQRLTDRKKPRIVQVELESEPFQANECHLFQDTELTKITLERARNYWNGYGGNGRTELLYVGKLTVLEVFQIPGS
ncbi:DUF2441 domain-containing protein [Aeromonas veronii]|uniref:DUF2441 domain-containing protein n=1 Tax=Aeromonas veronii TaxID=654 RepID=UPI001933A7DF|nr:DUF2441 domain-containing protein [Aeromonas veronii]MBM0417989.1 DUF2441 domain-containing protein [Aeromonas veronii]MBW3790059.1 DUF2441 domain-containing protein [Aeromonas veronii]MCO5341515.1 DUF2441 domain-containing protein [Aeromonas veronii]